MPLLQVNKSLLKKKKTSTLTTLKKHIGCAAAMLFGTILGLGALFPPQFTGAIMAGNGIAGIIAGGLRIITKAALSDGMSVSQSINSI